MHKEATPPAELNPQVSAGLGAVIDKALEKERNLRYQHASDMRTDLQRLKRDSESGRQAVARPSTPAATVQVTDAPPSPPRAVAPPKTRWPLLAGAALVLLGLLIGGGLYYRSRQTKPLTDKDTIVIADFVNKTGDAVFDDTLKTGLTVALNQSPFLNVLSDSKVRGTLKLMTLPANTKLTPEVVRDLCQRAGSKAYIEGSITSLGSEYVIELRAVNCQSGETSAQEQVTASGKEKVLNALGDAASRLRGELGESLGTVKKFDVPMEQVTTTSLEALKAFSAAKAEQTDKGWAAGIPLLKRAVELDPNFALAYAELGAAYSEVLATELSREYATRAFQLRDHASERERFRITTEYYDLATVELDKGHENTALWAQSYPRDALALHRLGAGDMWLGRYRDAVEHTAAALALQPDDPIALLNLIAGYRSTERYAEAADSLRKLEEKFPHFEEFRYDAYMVGFVQGDRATMQQQVTWADAQERSDDLVQFVYSYAADTEAYQGRVRGFREYSNKAIDGARTAGEEETSALWLAKKAQWEAELGYKDAARPDADASLARARTRDVKSMAGLALARAGDSKHAVELADELEHEFPERSFIRLYWVNTTRAAVEIKQGNPARALEFLEAARPYEASGYTIMQATTLYPAFVRGEAYLAMGDGDKAATEFKKFIDHPGMVANCPLAALARLGMARAYALQGDKAKAKVAYEDFLTLWKDAGPDIPIYKQAKAEYARLQ